MRTSFVSMLAAGVSGVLISVLAGDVALSAPRAPSELAPQRRPVVKTAAKRRTSSARGCLGAALGPGAFIGGDDSNVAAGKDSAVVAGYGNQVCDYDATIAGGSENLIFGGDTNGAQYGFIGGGSENSVTGAFASVANGTNNGVAAFYSFIGAGVGNSISPPGTEESAIVGGESNTVSAQYGFIGAGIHNTVSGEGAYVAAGGYNTASGEGAVIDGGFNSTASGAFATIPGGYGNSAAATYSFAAGARASAPYTGDFVWSDGSDGSAILTASRAYQFAARAAGGFTFYTNAASAASTAGAQLAAGSGTWASLSDRNAKTAIAPLDDDAILAKVAALPISRWSYRSEHGVRHIGPMAQDFYAAFGLGEDDRHIASLDEDGIALAAIKALDHRHDVLRAHNRRFHDEHRSLRVRLAELRAAVERVRDQLAIARPTCATSACR